MNTISFSPFTSIYEDCPPGVCVTGIPGSGKTFFLLNLAANCIMMGARVIFIDPKNDAKDLKNIDSSIKLTDINNITPGALNPFKVLKNPDTNTILSIIKCMCGSLSDEQLVEVTPIVNDFVKQNRKDITDTNFDALAEYLYSSNKKHAQTVGTILQTNSDSKYGKLLFAETPKDVFTLDGGSEVISLFGLPLPAATDDLNNLTNDKKFSSAIVYIICTMLNDILTEADKMKPTILFVDEAHILFVNNDILTVLYSYLSLGRSLGIPTVLSTQNMSNYPENILQMISNKFMFRMSKKQANLFLEAFDANESLGGFDYENITSEITNAQKGKCFFIDRKNRGGFIQIKSNFGNDINSNPLMKKSKKKES